ncbi:TetR/AcrR family transcriptional regulator [Pseudonocardia nematodicida]|uniref:TetR/AcrR family transcriptional regulator n=1 Tax=Pseudonocardia nematodicida TaxID=1206997 RepID=A0ABV1K742_9PSEU
MPTTPDARAGRRPGPKPRLTRDEIVEAAVAVGVDRLSVAAVADRLGVAPGTLYRYVGGLDEIATAAVALVLARTPLSRVDGGWRAFLEAEAALSFDTLLRHAALVRDLDSDLGAVAADRMQRIIAVLRAAGFGLGAATRVADAVLDIVADGVHQTHWVNDGHGELTGPARTYLATLEEPLRGSVAAIMNAPRAHVLDKVALVLDGVEHRRTGGHEGYADIE